MEAVTAFQRQGFICLDDVLDESREYERDDFYLNLIIVYEYSANQIKGLSPRQLEYTFKFFAKGVLEQGLDADSAFSEALDKAEGFVTRMASGDLRGADQDYLDMEVQAYDDDIQLPEFDLSNKNFVSIPHHRGGQDSEEPEEEELREERERQYEWNQRKTKGEIRDIARQTFLRHYDDWKNGQIRTKDLAQIMAEDSGLKEGSCTNYIYLFRGEVEEEAETV